VQAPEDIRACRIQYSEYSGNKKGRLENQPVQIASTNEKKLFYIVRFRSIRIAHFPTYTFLHMVI
jgi:hypothetical protein